jgi:HAD superfamily hydrolase (TIGR01484 family)
MKKRLFSFNFAIHSISMKTATVGVDKGSALQLLCNHLDMPVQDTIAFGDGENDKEFLAVAGLGCAMKNARPAAKSAANVVIEVKQCPSLK